MPSKESSQVINPREGLPLTLAENVKQALRFYKFPFESTKNR